MKCILVDGDEVLFDTKRHIAEILGIKYQMMHPTKYELEDWIPDRAAEARELMRTPEFWHTIPAKEGAQPGIKKMRDRNCDVICASSPYISCPLWYDVRRARLEELFDIKWKNFIPINRKELITDADTLIDDKELNIVNWENAAKKRAWLFTAGHNMHVRRHSRVNWETIDRIFS